MKDEKNARRSLFDVGRSMLNVRRLLFSFSSFILHPSSFIPFLLVSAPLIFLSEKIEWLMVHAIDPFAQLGIASIRLPHYHGWAASIYVIYFVCLSFVAVALFRWHPLRPAMITGVATFLRRSYLVSLVAVFGFILAVIIFHPLSATRADGKLHVDFLDVTVMGGACDVA